jgi:hypothetical protein
VSTDSLNSISGKVKVTLRRTVSQSVLVSSPIWGSWPDISSCLTFTVLSMCGALSSFVGVTFSLFQLNLDPRYIASGRPQPKTSFRNNSSVVTEVCLPRHCGETAVLLLLGACSFPQEPVYRVVASNKRLLWLRYSSFHASCHITILLYKWSV